MVSTGALIIGVIFGGSGQNRSKFDQGGGWGRERWANNPKVCWQKGEGGAPKEAGIRIDRLQISKCLSEACPGFFLSAIGMNGDVLDLEVRRPWPPPSFDLGSKTTSCRKYK